MNAEKLSQRWFLAAVTYFVIGLGFGVYMGGSGDHALFTVHSHITLLGWASMGLTGLVYRSFPAAAQTRLAVWHFWLYQLAVPVMLLAVAALSWGAKAADPVAGIASMVVLVSALLFWWAVFRARSRKAAKTLQQGTQVPDT
jgi:hypothetical protein